MPAYHDVVNGLLEKIAQKDFSELNYNSFYLEFDDDKAGPFDPLRFLPPDKSVVLGIGSTKSAAMEDIAKLEARVMEAAGVIANGQGRQMQDVIEDSLAVSPQCGFASISMGRGAGMTEERIWEKLLLLRDLSRRL